jgi:hypothetical protein
VEGVGVACKELADAWLCLLFFDFVSALVACKSSPMKTRSSLLNEASAPRVG